MSTKPETITEWMERHDLNFGGSMADARACFEDAQSVNLAVEPSDVISAGDALLKALVATQQMDCGCGDYGPCTGCTAAKIESAAAAEAWEEAKAATHLPDCDVNDANLEGIRKPCNCGHPHPAGSVTPTVAARRICSNWMSPTGDAHYRDVVSALQLQREIGADGAWEETKKEVTVETIRLTDLLSELIISRDECLAASRDLIPAADPTGDARLAYKVCADQLTALIKRHEI